MRAGKCKTSVITSALRPRKALFVTRLHPDTTSESVCELLISVMKATCFESTRLRSKFDTYTSFHIAVDDDKLDVVSDPELWPEGCLFRPFYGPLRDSMRCGRMNNQPDNGDEWCTQLIAVLPKCP